MKLLLALALAAAPALTHADKVFDGGRVFITFHENKPCAVQAAELLIVAYGSHSVPMAATVVLAGRQVPACWALDLDGDYIVVDEKGSGGVIFAKALKEPRGST